MSLADANANIDEIFSSMFTTVFPSMLALFAFMFFILKVVLPVVGDILEGRSQAQNSKAIAQAKSDQKRAATTKLIGLRSDFDDWLGGALLTLEIECAAQPNEPKRLELLDALKASKDNNAAQIENLHADTSENVPTTAEAGDVQHEWDILRNRLNLLPTTAATSAA